MSGLRRFLHLERPRSGAGERRETGGAAAGRFQGVLRPGPTPAAPSASGAELGRFGPEPEPSIQLVEADGTEQPFTRCMRCGMDHDVFATECSHCGASLDTGPQREFNERLWAGRREEAAREEAAAAERRALAERAEAELRASRRAVGEALARDAGRRRLGGDGDGWGLPRERRVERALRWLLGLFGG